MKVYGFSKKAKRSFFILNAKKIAGLQLMERSECLKMACQLQKWRGEEGAEKKKPKSSFTALVVTIIVSKEATENAILNTISKVLDRLQRTGTPP